MVFIEQHTDLSFEVDEKLLIVPILSDSKRHRRDNRISFIYIYSLTTDKEFVISCNHNDLNKNGTDWISTFNWPTTLYCYKKTIIEEFGIKCIDIELCYWLINNEPMDIELHNNIKFYSRRYLNLRNLNDIVPLVSYIIFCRTIKENALEFIYDVEYDRTLQFYNDIVLSNYKQIEDVGLPFNKELLKEYYSINKKTLYTEYNIYTATGRPSNKFGGINFAAMNKTTGQRSVIEIQNDNEVLVEYDFNSFHVHLVAKLIGYKLPESNLHEYFGRQYFNTPQLTDEQYEESKSITFQSLYGKILPQYSNIKFFKMVKTYINELWSQFKRAGYIEMPLSKRRIIHKNFPDMTPNKLFNYLLQGHETEVNSIMLRGILGYLYDKRSKLILYTYDSFLFRFDKDDGKEFNQTIRQILTQFNIPVNLKMGMNYHDMKVKQ